MNAIKILNIWMIFFLGAKLLYEPVCPSLTHSVRQSPRGDWRFLVNLYLNNKASRRKLYESKVFFFVFGRYFTCVRCNVVLYFKELWSCYIPDFLWYLYTNLSIISFLWRVCPCFFISYSHCLSFPVSLCFNFSIDISILPNFPPCISL